MTDPRFYEWLWDIEDEIRNKVPMVYHHVWDNYPYPKFNTKFYKSNDVIATISKLTDDIVRTLAPEGKCEYIPHSVDIEVFKKLDREQIQEIKKRLPYRRPYPVLHPCGKFSQYACVEKRTYKNEQQTRVNQDTENHGKYLLYHFDLLNST